MAQPPSDTALIEQIRDGDRAALGELLERHQHRLFSIALRMVSNRDDAAEVTQDAMLKIVQHFDSFRSEAQVTTWMTRIVMNQAISRLRRRKLRDHASLD
ncbi:MAG: RNA polymerase sigma factor, partial [Phycisphaeraceae bacterium]